LGGNRAAGPQRHVGAVARGTGTVKPETAFRTGTPDRGAHRARTEEQGHRPRTRNQREHRQAPPAEHLQQDRRARPLGIGGHGPDRTEPGGVKILAGNYSGSTTTAVPYASTSVAPCMTSVAS